MVWVIEPHPIVRTGVDLYSIKRRDGGWVRRLLEEAENERMHLMYVPFHFVTQFILTYILQGRS